MIERIETFPGTNGKYDLWRDGKYIGGDFSEETAREIVQAINAHNAPVEALKIYEALKKVKEWLDADDWSNGDVGMTIDFITSALEGL